MLNIENPEKIKYIISDFDGIMTDNFVFISDSLEMSKKISYKDIMAIALLRKTNRNIIYISGDKNPIIDMLKDRFKLETSYQDIRKKIDVLKNIIKEYNLSQDEYIYIGDDVNDLECLEFAKNKITVPNAVNKVKEIENIQITEVAGGNGAFREVVDCILNT
ncbi:MAG: HAD hydrolase family protein [bacterium]|nr:HAD hydrolase family protein [bacterium]